MLPLSKFQPLAIDAENCSPPPCSGTLIAYVHLAGTRVEQCWLGTRTAAEQELGFLGLEVVEVIVGGQLDLAELADDDPIGVQWQHVDQ